MWFDNLSSAMITFGHQDYASIVAKDEENFLDRNQNGDVPIVRIADSLAVIVGA